jgi:magnesium chelatase accessory protein
MRAAPDWQVEGRDWPNREASRFVSAAGRTWHVQVMGRGPTLLLLHGTGAATHSWRGVAPLLARHFTIVAPDLAGHGFSEPPRRTFGYTLPGVAQDVRALLAALNMTPQAIVGHSAGAAIAVRLALDGLQAPVVSLNGALKPLPGALSILGPITALAFLNPFALRMFAVRAAAPGAVARLMRSTGSTLDAAGLDYYRRLLTTERHLRAAISLMANWDLAPLQHELSRLSVPLTLIVADHDRAVPPHAADAALARAPHANRVRFPRAGHLAHEENPALAAQLIREALAG